MTDATIVSRGPSPFVPGFELFDVKIPNGLTLRVATGGREGKTPLLMVHGHPHNHVIWRKVAPTFARDRRVILVDLRGYGDSSKPESMPDHRPYSKRVMAEDLAQLLKVLGVERCDFVGHDRGGRVGHRFALDWPELVRKAVFVDIAPTKTMYERTEKEFATRYFWWFFLIQPEPFPEKLINFDPEYFLRHHIGGQLKIPGSLEEEVFQEYCAATEIPRRVMPFAKTTARPPRSTSKTTRRTPISASRRRSFCSGADAARSESSTTSSTPGATRRSGLPAGRLTAAIRRMRSARRRFLMK